MSDRNEVREGEVAPDSLQPPTEHLDMPRTAGDARRSPLVIVAIGLLVVFALMLAFWLVWPLG